MQAIKDIENHIKMLETTAEVRLEALKKQDLEIERLEKETAQLRKDYDRTVSSYEGRLNEKDNEYRKMNNIWLVVMVIAGVAQATIAYFLK